MQTNDVRIYIAKRGWLFKVYFVYLKLVFATTKSSSLNVEGFILYVSEASSNLEFIATTCSVSDSLHSEAGAIVHGLVYRCKLSSRCTSRFIALVSSRRFVLISNTAGGFASTQSVNINTVRVQNNALHIAVYMVATLVAIL